MLFSFLFSRFYLSFRFILGESLTHRLCVVNTHAHKNQRDRLRYSFDQFNKCCCTPVKTSFLNDCHKCSEMQWLKRVPLLFNLFVSLQYSLWAAFLSVSLSRWPMQLYPIWNITLISNKLMLIHLSERLAIWIACIRLIEMEIKNGNQPFLVCRWNCYLR